MYWSALTIGLIGGLHCSLMCSPLLAAVFTQGKFNVPFLIYQVGRITTYVLIGSIFFFLGAGFEMIGFQQAFSLLIAAYVIYFYLIPASWRHWPWLKKLESKPYHWFKNTFQSYFKSKSNKGRFFQGLLNGLLPCGLVYLAVANSLLADNYVQAIMSMAIFGLATIPWLVGAFLILKAPVFTATRYLNKLKPVLVFLLVCFLVLRGMGIDYLHLPMPHTFSNSAELVIPICGS